MGVLIQSALDEGCEGATEGRPRRSVFTGETPALRLQGVRHDANACSFRVASRTRNGPRFWLAKGGAAGAARYVGDDVD